MKENEIIFESENIIFIKPNKYLIEEYLKMVNEPDVSKYISLKERTFTYEDELLWLEKKEKNKSIIFSMLEKETNEFIGNVEVFDITNNVAEIAICITLEKQGKHYGEEALKRFMKYCLETRKLDNVELSVYSHNHKAINLYKKLGLVEYDRKENVGFYENEQIDDIYMRLN